MQMSAQRLYERLVENKISRNRGYNVMYDNSSDIFTLCETVVNLEKKVEKMQKQMEELQNEVPQKK